MSGNIVYYSITQYTTTPTYTVDAKGYAFGTNVTYLTQASGTSTLVSNRAAQKYSVVGTTTISGVVVVAARHSSTAGTSMVTAKIYSENATTKAPGSAVGAAGTKALNSFTGTGDQITFATPIVVPAGKFFASIESPAFGGATKDTLAISSTKETCSSTDSLSWQYTQLNGGGGFWSSVMSGDASANLDLLIFPVADVGPSTVGINSISKGDLTLLAAFPNPANNEVNINFGLNQDSKVDITLYDVAGKEISTLSTDVLPAGNHSQPLNVSALGAGVYMYSIKSKGGQLFSRFTVAK